METKVQRAVFNMHKQTVFSKHLFLQKDRVNANPPYLYPLLSRAQVGGISEENVLWQAFSGVHAMKAGPWH